MTMGLGHGTGGGIRQGIAVPHNPKYSPSTKEGTKQLLIVAVVFIFFTGIVSSCFQKDLTGKLNRATVACEEP
jgi:hypothetical protein